MPENVDQILTDAFIREAHVIRDFGILDALHVNTDQTQIVYQQGTKTSWSQKNLKQVSVVGHNEKRAFTLVPSIAANGDLLPMQAIFHGKTPTSCPSPKSPFYDDAIAFGTHFVPSKTDTYWSTQETMRDLKKQELGLGPDQNSLWKIDCWSVHKSREFLDWMAANHGNIIVIFIPGNCTVCGSPWMLVSSV
ncbi:hypothetical protein BDZ89DRAFT_1220417 [Hymenopellis radicata]|nr:hypothetical protein BDZ89DRAFT_1220417 [Hymenopellis radicata]